MRRGIVLFVLIAAGMVLGANLFAQELIDAAKWSAMDDKGDKGSSTCQVTAQEEEIAGQKYFVVTMSGEVTTKFQYGYIIANYEMDPDTLAKIVAGKKITFKALGDGEFYKLRLDTPEAKDKDFYLFSFKTKKDKVVEVTAEFSKFKQEGWGKHVSFKKENIVALAFQTTGQPHKTVMLKVFDFKIE